MPEKKTYYITTPIYYPSGNMHITAEDIVVGFDDFAMGDGNIYLGIPGYPQKATEVWEKLIDAALAEERT